MLAFGYLVVESRGLREAAAVKSLATAVLPMSCRRTFEEEMT